MPLRLYMDEHVPRNLSLALRSDGIDVLMLREDRALGKSDVWVPDRASSLGRVVCTMDAHFLVEAARRQRASLAFGGVIFIASSGDVFGETLDDLKLLCGVFDEDELLNRTQFIPLREADR